MSADRLDVLLVDDDEDVLVGVEELLARRHAVRAVLDFRAAIAALATRVPDVIVCDLDLAPYRGDALLQLVAREHPQVRRVLYTASLSADDGAFDEVAHAVVIKPGTVRELYAAIEGDGE